MSQSRLALRSLSGRVASWILGRHAKVHGTLRVVLIAAAVYVISLMAEWQAVSSGMAAFVDHQPASHWSVARSHEVAARR